MKKKKCPDSNNVTMSVPEGCEFNVEYTLSDGQSYLKGSDYDIDKHNSHFWDTDRNRDPFKEAKDIPGSTFRYNEDPILLDPRHKKLGGRLIINLEKLFKKSFILFVTVFPYRSCFWFG